MHIIYVVCEYALCRKQKIAESTDDFIFQEIIENTTIEVNISYSRGCATAKVFGEKISKNHVAELIKHEMSDADKLSPPCRKAISSIVKLASEFTKRILTTIKYHLDHHDFSENTFAIKSLKWGLTQDNLHHIPLSISIVMSGGGSICPLRQDSYEKIAASLNSGIKPLLAMRHLHRARAEQSAHHKWLDATIAAELAIKEALSRANPDIEALLLELPSPPIAKLYGKIMEQYLGEKSPYRKSLIKGAEIRNSLIHRHDDQGLDDQKAVNYVIEVEKAIFHLLTLLYPDDALIQSTYSRKI